jgi:SAM-dependent methyltransferase
MTRQDTTVPAGSYGVDAPYLLAVPVLLFVPTIVQAVLTRSPWALIGAVLIGIATAIGFHTSRRGKFAVWASLLDSLALRGDEEVLDLGCGRGAVLVQAAIRVPHGRAVGVDLWRRGDQAGNAPEATLRNAAAAGVADRVTLETADMTSLPFPDASFDLVVSNVALHNIKGTAGREAAVDEAVRVLRPGARLMLADLAGTDVYVGRLRTLGLTDVERRDLGWRLWWSGPWLPTKLVTATKPLGE